MINFHFKTQPIRLLQDLDLSRLNLRRNDFCRNYFSKITFRTTNKNLNFFFKENYGEYSLFFF